MGGRDESNSSLDNEEFDLVRSKLEPKLLLYTVGGLAAALCI